MLISSQKKKIFNFLFVNYHSIHNRTDRKKTFKTSPSQRVKIWNFFIYTLWDTNCHSKMPKKMYFFSQGVARWKTNNWNANVGNTDQKNFLDKIWQHCHILLDKNYFFVLKTIQFTEFLILSLSFSSKFSYICW